MRHGRLKGKLGVKTAHRKALLRNLVRGLVIRKQIKTTLRRAKVASAFADSMVELAKRGDLHARRLLIAELGCAQTANTLITRIAPHFKDRKGGYTRVLRIGLNRVGDAAQVALLEFTATIEAPEKSKAKKEKKMALKPADTEETAKPKKEKLKASEKEESKKTPESPEAKKAEKKDSEKKGGFLGALRRFLKGDDESR